MNINYKITTWVLLGIILATLCWSWGSMHGRGHMRYDHGMHMKGKMMHQMNPDQSMGSMMMDMTARMKGKTGDDLDKIFLEDMVVHHQGAVDMAVELQKGTKRPELQKMAKDIIDAQTKEIEMMKGWKSVWFK